jgi:hypothetical protein
VIMVNKKEKAVIDAAIAWWVSRRPLAFGEEDHLENPRVNCSGAEQIAMARAVAKYLKAEK